MTVVKDIFLFPSPLSSRLFFPPLPVCTCWSFSSVVIMILGFDSSGPSQTLQATKHGISFSKILRFEKTNSISKAASGATLSLTI